MLKRFKSYRTLAEALLRAVEQGDVKTISFDVFDTLIHRRLAPALVIDGVCRIFEDFLVRHEIAPPPRPLLDYRHDAYLRLAATHVAAGFDPDTTLDELAPLWVAGVVGDSLTAPALEAMAKQLVAAEVEIERRVCFPNPWLKAILPQLKELGANVQCISDMYLGKIHVASILEDCGLLPWIDEVHVSGDVRLLKRSGRLFAHVGESSELSPGKWLHVGDNLHADGLMANRNGTRAWIINDQLMHDEARRQEFDVGAYQSNPSWAGMIAAGYADARAELDLPQEEAFSRKILGPIFAAFIHRLVERCKETGVGHVYFFAREGHLLKQLYLKLAPLAFPDGNWPPATYLAISRLTALLAAMHGYGLREFAAAMANTGHYSVRSLLAPLRLDEALLASAAARNGIADTDASLPTPLLEYPPLLRLIDDPELIAHIAATGENTRELLHAYLAQEGFFAHERIAVVDLGWGGQIQDSLYSSVRVHPNCPTIFGFYLGTNHQAALRHCAQNRFEGLLADSRTPHWSAAAAFEFVFALEAAARAPHGTTIGYRRNRDGTVIPLFRDSDDPSRRAEMADDGFIARLQNGILCYVERYGQCAALVRFDGRCSLPYARTLLERLIRYPTQQEIIWWQALSNVADLGSTHTDRLGGMTGASQPSLFSLRIQLKTTSFHYGLTGKVLGRLGQMVLSAVKGVRTWRQYRPIPETVLPPLPMSPVSTQRPPAPVPQWEQAINENFVRNLAEAAASPVRDPHYRQPRLTWFELAPLRLSYLFAGLLAKPAGVRLPIQEAPSMVTIAKQYLHARYNLRARVSLLLLILRRR
ncbi:MAG: hypothetical protein M0P39_03485 [Rhodocyclaceae bacterium]|nr:hypothetical protein [Rhodocyclaceae bacterium]